MRDNLTYGDVLSDACRLSHLLKCQYAEALCPHCRAAIVVRTSHLDTPFSWRWVACHGCRKVVGKGDLEQQVVGYLRTVVVIDRKLVERAVRPEELPLARRQEKEGG